MRSPDSGTWSVYVIRCDGRLYTGITTDVERRFREHSSGGTRAARFTRSAEQVELVYQVKVGDRSTALRIEHRIKRLSRERKLELIKCAPAGSELRRRLIGDTDV